MARDLNAELSEAKRELRNAVRELYDIASGVERSFKGIGNDKCAKNIRNIAQKYKGDIEIRQEESDGRFYFILNIMLMG